MSDPLTKLGLHLAGVELFKIPDGVEPTAYCYLCALRRLPARSRPRTPPPRRLWLCGTCLDTVRAIAEAPP